MEHQENLYSTYKIDKSYSALIFILIILTIFCFKINTALAEDSNDKNIETSHEFNYKLNRQESLDQIKFLQDKILSSNSQLSQLEKDIKNIDEKISKKVLLLEDINNELNKISSEQLNLNTKKSQSLKNLELQKQLLTKQLEAIYIMNKNHNLQKLSNIDNIQKLNRAINYIESYSQYNNTNISSIKNTLKDIEDLDNNLKSLNSQQQKNKAIVSKSYKELKKLKQQNIALKNELKNNLNNDLSKLDYYQKQYSKLNAILNKTATLDKSKNTSAVFFKSRGRLPVPVSGIIDIDFKNKKSKNAIFIKTKEGNKVKAVFSGTVVFSNWLRGFGFLTIVDHGGGYMSLYGNNQTLLKTTGSVVEAGEAIAISGSSGGATVPGLYFELRHNGSSINTIAWLKGDIGRSVG